MSFAFVTPYLKSTIKLHLFRFTEKWVSQDYKRLPRDCTVKMTDRKRKQNRRWKQNFFQNYKTNLCLSESMIDLLNLDFLGKGWDLKFLKTSWVFLKQSPDSNASLPSTVKSAEEIHAFINLQPKDHLLSHASLKSSGEIVIISYYVK